MTDAELIEKALAAWPEEEYAQTTEEQRREELNIQLTHREDPMERHTPGECLVCDAARSLEAARAA